MYRELQIIILISSKQKTTQKRKEEIKWQETLTTVERERERERYNLTKKKYIQVSLETVQSICENIDMGCL